MKYISASPPPSELDEQTFIVTLPEIIRKDKLLINTRGNMRTSIQIKVLLHQSTNVCENSVGFDKPNFESLIDVLP